MRRRDLRRRRKKQRERAEQKQQAHEPDPYPGLQPDAPLRDFTDEEKEAFVGALKRRLDFEVPDEGEAVN